MTPAVAIVGMACRYPDADTPEALWENVLAQRRAFRRMPAERLHPDDYWSPDRAAPDRTYAAQAAVLEGYAFDRVGFRVSGSTYRAVDPAHWLALDVATQALADAGFAEGASLPRAVTGVLLGNTLTGEFSRANVMRLRWPYVRRVLDAALAGEGWAASRRGTFLEHLEMQYKAPFPPVGTETLAGGLSNTIAGRICNYFDLKGGGYTVDGACASSLLAVIHACTAVAAGDLDVALAGGVDLSLDPFELVGFAQVGALAEQMMRVYDARAEGFWPGEGCGFVVLMRHDEAVRQGRRVYAVIRGWGVSSDGSGGITRPEVDGQILAVRRAWQRAGVGIETAALFEGHGTGTPVGDTTELQMLTRARREAAPEAPPAAIGSVKANIGHTKAAAGVAGLLKATLALHHQLLPPTTGCDTPHPELAADDAALRVLHDGERWPADQPLRAGVSAMGFGGINTHIVLENPVTERYGALTPTERRLLASVQDAELFVLGDDTAEGLRAQVDFLLTLAPKLSLAELADLAAALAAGLRSRAVRAAVVASTPDGLTQRLERLAGHLADGVEAVQENGVYLGTGVAAPTIGFLFPGQASPAHPDGGLWRRRFAPARALYDGVDGPEDGDDVATDVAQPAIVRASLAGLRVLDRLGVRAQVAVGHSLGELVALHWAGALDDEALLALAAARGRAMADLGNPMGSMASIAAGPDDVAALIDGTPVVIAGLNGPQQTVVSGDADALDAVTARAQARGWSIYPLRVSHAFHSPLMEAAAAPLAEYLTDHPLRPVQRPVVSTVTGALLTPSGDLAALLVRQVTAPVRFTEAMHEASPGVDLWIEVGPGRVLSGLAVQSVDGPVVSIDAGGPSMKPLLEAAGAAFALGAPVQPAALFDGRFTRPFDLDHEPQFLANPCEQAPLSDPTTRAVRTTLEGLHINGHDPEVVQEVNQSTPSPPGSHAAQSPIDLLRRLVARRTELPLEAVRDGDRLLSDLHLNSITVSELVNDAARRLGLPPSPGPSSYADASLKDVAEAMEARGSLKEEGTGDDAARPPSGVDAWVRPFTVALVERPRPRPVPAESAGSGNAWPVIAPDDHPLKALLQEAFGQVEGDRGVVVALPPEVDVRHVGLLLEGARAVMAEATPGRFVLVQHGGGAAAFARTLHLEVPPVTACVVDVPVDHPDAVAWIRAEAQAATAYTEVYYDAAGARREPRLRHLPLADDPEAVPLGPDDVLLVTGGGKGITAACALALGRATGARLVLLGRSQPDANAELAATLADAAGAGLAFRYVVADVTDATAVRAAIDEATAAFGPVTAVLHGAARNVPRRLAGLTEDDFRKTLAPKVDGLRNVLAALDPERLRLLVTFGSIIGRMGLPGEADYALANEWLTRAAERWSRTHPHCRCLAVEWSIWSGVGMGARLGSIEALAAHGVSPITPEEGTALLRRLLARPLPATAVVVAGRWGEPPTLRAERPDLPLLRFLETPRVVYPGVELVVEAQLSVDTDPYLDDHVLQGERLLPAVLGLEAMAQAALAVTGTTGVPVFEEVAFSRPVVVPARQPLTIRVAALVRAPGTVEVVLRSEQTHFQADHFRAVCRFDAPDDASPLVQAHPVFYARTCDESSLQDPCVEATPEAFNGAAPVDLDPERDLYGGILFHRGRFRRLRGYRALRATACLAEVMPDGATTWFGRYLPADLVLGDPGARDAAIHAIQACIPHATLIPLGVDRLAMHEPSASGARFVHARERAREGDTFVYDVAVTDAEGRLLERWEGLRLQRVGAAMPGTAWPAPLLGPYLERRVQDVLPAADVSVAVLRDDAAGRRARSDRALRQALGAAQPVRRRANGKPEAAGARSVSASHAGGLTLAVAGTGPLGCDLEPVAARPGAVWRDLLGPDGYVLARLLAREAGDDLAVAATRVWTALESLKKAGAPPGTPVVLDAVPGDGWVVLGAGPYAVASYVTPISNTTTPSVLSILVTPQPLALKQPAP